MRVKLEKRFEPVSAGEWVAQMERCTRHCDVIRLRNAPAIEKNRQLLRWSREHRPGEPVRLYPMPHHPDPWARLLLDRELAVKRALRDRTPEQWERVVGELMPPLRNAVARLVWWDYFGGRLVSEAWSHLNKYTHCPHVEVSDAKLVMGLQKVGYSPWEARLRVKGIEALKDEFETSNTPSSSHETD